MMNLKFQNINAALHMLSELVNKRNFDKESDVLNKCKNLAFIKVINFFLWHKN